MKKLINAPKDVVEDMLRGLVALYPNLSLLADEHVLFRSDIEAIRDAQVALISGGGSGHEPAHAGYVGAGMLSAAVAGEVFTSPTPDAVIAAIREVSGKQGVLLIVKNYTGDRLNFGIAAEMARSEEIAVETVTVADDVALAGSGEYAGARGLAGTVLVHKIAGACAAAGASLTEVASVARAAAAELGTIGLSLSAGTVPAVGKPSYMLADDEVELGLGIHGEPGVRRMPLRSADELTEQMVTALASSSKLAAGERVVLLVNNLGATTAMELAIFGGRAVRLLLALGLKVERVYSGAFMTSLEAAGVSLSVLRVDDERLRLLDAPTSAPAWPNASGLPPTAIEERIILPGRSGAGFASEQAEANPLLQKAIRAGCEALIAAEARLTGLDGASGDGDLGINLARAAEAVSSLDMRGDAAAVLRAVALEFQRVAGGSSGPFYSVMLLRAGQSLQGKSAPAARDWAQAALDACEAITELGGAKPGDRTMLDALVPFATEFERSVSLKTAVRAAEAGAEATASMKPRRGRASYLGERVIGNPDPGAVAVAIWLRALQRALSNFG
ncbi:MAG: dihydroxyacetone kinase subunit DhaK [Acidobacteriaceae bacterium]|nr:dihydroxyacetone kinase subunit DhaK [Acidobacteriaceae bacterium]